MRTARSVMALFLLILASLVGSGQSDATRPAGPADAVITVTGRDEASIPLPLPWRQLDVPIPPVSPWEPPAFVLPAIAPPSDDWVGDDMPLPDPLREIAP